MSSSGSEHIQSLERGLSVIRAFTRERPSLTLTDVATATDLTRATARRFLLTLDSLGYASTDGKTWRLTPRVLDLGYSYLSSLGLPDVIAPHLETLSAHVHESASAAVLDGSDIVYIARVEGRKIMRVQITVGTRFPAFATSMGRVLLAGLSATDAKRLLESSSREKFTPQTTTSVSALMTEIDRVRADGYSLVDQELETGLRSVAVPVWDASGNVVAAINVSTTATGSPEETLQRLLGPLREAAAQSSPAPGMVQSQR